MTIAAPAPSLVHPGLTIDADHVYRFNGVQVPSVTQVINSIMPGWQADEWYLQRGTAMHHGCRLHDDGKLDWSSVAPEIAGRVRAWQKFRSQFPAKVVACEQSLCHPVFMFAGTLDRALLADGALVICDLKSSIAPQVKVQLGAYRLLWEHHAGVVTRNTKGLAVELSDDGSYRTLWVDRGELDRCGRTFLSALTVFNFKQRESLK
jgi:hypothetical protein